MSQEETQGWQMQAAENQSHVQSELGVGRVGKDDGVEESEMTKR